jgi:hypothetical protein
MTRALTASIAAIVALLLAAAAQGAPATTAEATDYAIKLFSPAKVGDKYKVTATGTDRQEQTQTPAGGEAQKAVEEYTVQFVGVAEIAEVDKAGSATKVTYAVEKCDRIAGDEKTQIVAAGKSIVQTHKDGENVYTVDDEALAEPVAKALNVIMPNLDPDMPNSDELIGTKDRQKVGASWAVNAESLAKALSGKLAVKAQDIQGTCKLVDVKLEGGRQWLHVEAEVTARNIQIPVPNSTTTKGVLTLKTSGLWPADAVGEGRSQTGEVRLEATVVAKDANGNEVTVDIVNSQKTRTQAQKLEK